MSCEHGSWKSDGCGWCFGLAERAAHEQTKADYDKERGAHRGTASILLAMTNRVAALESELARARPLLSAAVAFQQARDNVGQVAGHPGRRLHDEATAYARAKAEETKR